MSTRKKYLIAVFAAAILIGPLRSGLASEAEDTLEDFHSGGKNMFVFRHTNDQVPGLLDGPIRVKTLEYSVSKSKRYLTLWAYLPRTVRMAGDEDMIQWDVEHGGDPDVDRVGEVTAFVVVDSADPGTTKGAVRWAMYVDKSEASADLVMLNGPDSVFVVVNWSHVNTLYLALFRVGSEPITYFRQLGPFPYKLSTHPPKEAETPAEAISTLFLHDRCVTFYQAVHAMPETGRNRILVVANRVYDERDTAPFRFDRKVPVENHELFLCEPTYLRFDLTSGKWTHIPAKGQLLEAQSPPDAQTQKSPKEMFTFREHSTKIPGWLDGPNKINTLAYSVSKAKRYLTLCEYSPRTLRICGDKQEIEQAVKNGLDPDQSRCQEATGFVVVDSADASGMKGVTRWGMYVDKENVSADLAMFSPDSIFAAVAWSDTNGLNVGLFQIGSKPSDFFKRLGQFPFRLSTPVPQDAQSLPEPISTLILNQECSGGFESIHMVAEPSRNRILLVANHNNRVCEPEYLRFDLAAKKWTRLPAEGRVLEPLLPPPYENKSGSQKENSPAELDNLDRSGNDEGTCIAKQNNAFAFIEKGAWR